jgi:hypothetical protein
MWYSRAPPRDGAPRTIDTNFLIQVASICECVALPCTPSPRSIGNHNQPAAVVFDTGIDDDAPKANSDFSYSSLNGQVAAASYAVVGGHGPCQSQFVKRWLIDHP